jgi:hypothetical protein
MPAPDPWTAFLDWLSTVIIPNWGELISMLPFFLVVGVIGPLVTLIGLLWVWYLIHRSRGRVQRDERQAVRAPLHADGRPVFPPNVPYCAEHGLLYPPRVGRCEIDRADLSVTCPVDGTVRVASVQTCPACGTRFVLGAGSTATLVSGSSGPPEGGAAVA